jgi:hypothetical protein
MCHLNWECGSGIQRTDRRARKVLVLEDERYGYHKHFSDIVGLEIIANGNDEDVVIRTIRNWLATESLEILPSPKFIQQHCKAFKMDLSNTCGKPGLSETDLIFNDYAILVSEWLQVNSKILQIVADHGASYRA